VIPKTGTACDDKLACTIDDHCDTSGQCVGKPSRKFTGGGQSNDDRGDRWSFGGNVRTKKSPSEKDGEFNAERHGDKFHIHGDVSDIRCGSDCGDVADEGITFTVTDKTTGTKYTVKWKDGGRRNGWIRITGPGLETGCHKGDNGEIHDHGEN
jgi:hypothetical protein